MPYLIKSIGIIIAIIGVIFATMPVLVTKIIEYAKVGKRIYIAGVVRVIVGLLLLIAVPQATLQWLVGVIGAVILISGISIFFIGIARATAFLNWWEAKPEATRRLGAIIIAVIGVLLIYGA